MRTIIAIGLAAMLAISAAHADAVSAAPINIVAAENFYGDIAEQIGGPDVTVTSILSNPDQDPHLFEVSPSVGRAVSAARIVIYNGIDYDPWLEKLLTAARSAHRKTIAVATLVGRKSGDNPHIWYDPKTMLALARTLAADLTAEDPARRAGYQQRLTRFEGSVRPIEAKIAALRERLAGTPVTATEPIFGCLFDALGMQVRNQPFQVAVMNNTEPSAADIAAFENDLKTHRVKLLIYNSQATDPTADRMRKIAQAANVPVVGVTETEPPGKNYQAWMMSELAAVDQSACRRAPVNVIEFCDVTLRLGGRDVLAGVSLQIAAGEFIGVLGPNGAGKTTLMRAVLGLVPASSGRIDVLGRPAARGNPAVGYMPQIRSSVGGMRLRGWDFVASVVAGHRLGLPILGRAARAEVDRALDLVGARELARRPLAETSGGEQQRLLLAQALIGQPRLLLLDEPLMNLDPPRQEAVVALVKSLQLELGITVLFSAHELNPLLGVLDRVLYLGRGQAALGAVDEVITESVLSRLYGAEIEVVRARRAGSSSCRAGHDVERDAHRHDKEPAHAHELQRSAVATMLEYDFMQKPSRRRRSSRSFPGWSATFWCCAARPSPVMPLPMSALPAPPGRF